MNHKILRYKMPLQTFKKSLFSFTYMLLWKHLKISPRSFRAKYLEVLKLSRIFGALLLQALRERQTSNVNILKLHFDIEDSMRYWLTFDK